MKNRLIFFSKKQKLYKKFHKQGNYSSLQVQEIIEKLKYNQPKIYENQPNFEVLNASGINSSLPIYVEKLEYINIAYAKNLWLAQKIYNFNLVIFYKNKTRNSIQTFLKNSVFLEQGAVSKTLKNNLAVFNINTESENIVLEKNSKESIEIENFTMEKVKYSQYFLSRIYKNLNKSLTIQQTFSNGIYYFFDTKDLGEGLCSAELKFLLKSIKKAYYCIKKINNGIEIINIITNKKNYFIFSNKKFTYKIIPIKNSYNYKLIICFKINNYINLFCYFGKESSLNKANLNYALIKSQIIQKLNNKYFIKINSDNKMLDFYINYYLPKQSIIKKIEEKNSNKEINSKNIFEIIHLYKIKQLNALDCYNKLISCLLKSTSNGFVFFETELLNYQLEILFNGNKKVINIHKGFTKKLVIDNITYYNTTLISHYAINNFNQFDIYF